MLVPHDRIAQLIRKLAKGNYWQTLYSQSKEVSGIQLFENTRDFTEIQVMFLNYLGFYNAIFLDIVTGDVEDLVFKDEIYEDAYMYYRNKTKYTQHKPPSKDSKVVQKEEQQRYTPKDRGINRLQLKLGETSWVFRKKSN